MFDIAHLSGTAATAAMTVAQAGDIDSKYFRHFKIKSAKPTSDVDMMAEIISRRLKRADWPWPDLIVLDGGVSQLSILHNLTSHPPIIGLAKQFETIIIPQENGEYKELRLSKSNKGLLLLMHLRDQAHRFSRRLHHHQRSKSFLT